MYEKSVVGDSRRKIEPPIVGQRDIDDALTALQGFYEKAPLRFVQRLTAILSKVKRVRILSWQDTKSGEVYTVPPLQHISSRDLSRHVRSM